MLKRVREWAKNHLDKKAMMTSALIGLVSLIIAAPSGYVSGRVAQTEREVNAERDLRELTEKVTRLEKQIEDMPAMMVEQKARLEEVQNEIQQLRKNTDQAHELVREQSRRIDRILEILVSRRGS